ncbi:MAG: ATP-binding protein [Anaerolineae bacterium]
MKKRSSWAGAEERLATGTGLGLSVAQSLVQAQGGRIWVESTPGEGGYLSLHAAFRAA